MTPRARAVPAAALAIALLAASTGSAGEHRVAIGDSVIQLSIEGAPAMERDLVQWVSGCGRAVAGYLGRFPTPHVRLIVRTRPGDRVGGGVTHGGRAPAIRIHVGRDADRSDLARDWVLTHEMLHLAFPDLTTDDRWAEEGLSTYAEPVARARKGQISAEAVWSDLLGGVPNGLPSPEDEGLHGTEEWGRTYWGGALFWLLADVEIRRETANRRGLEHALAAVVEAGGDIRARWPLSRVLEIGDRATGTRVLTKLYARLGLARGDVDPDDLWRRLGVRRSGRSVTFDESAPLAHVRRAITARSTPAEL